MKSLTFRVFQSDDSFLSLCDQLPSIACGGNTETEALQSIFELIERFLSGRSFSTDEAIAHFKSINAAAALNWPSFEQASMKYKIFWSNEDNEYVAICNRFELLSYLGENPSDALSGLLEVIRDNLADKS